MRRENRAAHAASTCPLQSNNVTKSAYFAVSMATGAHNSKSELRYIYFAQRCLCQSVVAFAAIVEPETNGTIANQSPLRSFLFLVTFTSSFPRNRAMLWEFLNRSYFGRVKFYRFPQSSKTYSSLFMGENIFLFYDFVRFVRPVFN